MKVKIPLVMLKFASRKGLKKIPKKSLAHNVEESKMHVKGNKRIFFSIDVNLLPAKPKAPKVKQNHSLILDQVVTKSSQLCDNLVTTL